MTALRPHLGHWSDQSICLDAVIQPYKLQIFLPPAERFFKSESNNADWFHSGTSIGKIVLTCPDFAISKSMSLNSPPCGLIACSATGRSLSARPPSISYDLAPISSAAKCFGRPSLFGSRRLDFCLRNGLPRNTWETPLKSEQTTSRTSIARFEEYNIKYQRSAFRNSISISWRVGDLGIGWGACCTVGKGGCGRATSSGTSLRGCRGMFRNNLQYGCRRRAAGKGGRQTDCAAGFGPVVSTGISP